MSYDTIFALSSGRPPAGVAVVRLSGPCAFRTLERLAGRAPPPRTATLATLRDDAGDILDRALVLAFPAPNSFTGEDVAELHLHGGGAVVAAVLATLDRLGLRLANPGEFSRRAFDNGKLDLTEAEGLADLIAAETETQRRQALAQAGGRLRARAEDWRLRILMLQAEAEADLDFSDEDDVDVTPDPTPIIALAAEIAAALDDNHLGERLRDGFTLAVVGAPNAGKSSLINALAEREVAIVTPHAGTTRDVIEVPLSIEGVPVTLLDTAGLRDSDDPIEAEGIRRARARAAAADLVLHVIDATAPPPAEIPGAWPILNKTDLLGSLPSLKGRGRGGSTASPPIPTSTKTPDGLNPLRAALRRWATTQATRAESALITQHRHRTALTAAVSRLIDAATTFDTVVRAEHLRLAARAIGEITGRVGVEDMLDELFGRFCIGK